MPISTFGLKSKPSSASVGTLQVIAELSTYGGGGQCIHSINVHLFTHSFSKSVLSSSHGPGPLLGSGNKAVNRTDTGPRSSGAETSPLQITQAGRLEDGSGRRHVSGVVPDFSLLKSLF